MAEQKAIAFLADGKVSLRPSTKNDVQLFLRWFNNPEVTRFTATRFPVYESQEEKFIEDRPSRQPSEVHLVIEVEGNPIGVISLMRIDYLNGTAETGTVIGEKESWGKGYGTAAKILLLKFAFLQLNLRKIYSRAIAFNGRSLRYSEKCGYKVEARLRKDRYCEGTYHDLVILSVYRKRWLKQFCS
jgi:RimJ/RimL family protein N-acetyltransferase